MDHGLKCLVRPHISTNPLPSFNMHSSDINVLNVFSDNKTKIWDSVLRVLGNNLFTQLQGEHVLMALIISLDY